MIEGKRIIMKLVEIDEDADFIFRLRKDKGKFLSKSTSWNEHINFLRHYKEKEKKGEEYYFVILHKLTKEKLGVVRMYDFRTIDKRKSFCWGSWIIKDNAPKFTAIESALQIYNFGFYELGFEMSHFDVRKENVKVVNFHRRFGAKIVKEDNENYYFHFLKRDFENIKKKYKKYL